MMAHIHSPFLGAVYVVYFLIITSALAGNPIQGVTHLAIVSSSVSYLASILLGPLLFWKPPVALALGPPNLPVPIKLHPITNLTFGRKCRDPDKVCGTACCEPDNPPPGFINVAACANATRSLCCVINEIDCNGVCCKPASCCNGTVCCGAGTACLDGVCAVPPPETKEHCLLLSYSATGDLCNTPADCKPPGLICAQGCCFWPPPA